MKKILIIYSDYYPDISKGLVTNAVSYLKKDFNIYKLKVPGCYEIPISIIKRIKKFDGFIALGCIIQGETAHFHFISQSINNALMKIMIDKKKPIGNGILTCVNKQQAKKRFKKGIEAAIAVKMLIS